MRIAIALALAVWCHCGGLWAGQPATSIESATPEISSKKRGDEITLRSGRSLQGVRVLSETQIEVKVEVLPGLPPLVLPASQVQSIRYESLPASEPRAVGKGSKKNSAASPTELLPARKISPFFSKRLASKMGTEPRAFENLDIVQILKTVAGEKKVAIRFSQGVLARPETKRRCTISTRAGQSLDSFLQTSVAAEVSWIKIDYTFDALQVGLTNE